MRNEFGKRRGFHIAKFLVMGVVFIIVVGFATMLLWNYLIPELFHGPVITYWQALGLLLLGKLLFGWHNHQRSWGGGGRWGGGGDWKARIKEKMAHMTPEQQEKMKQHLRNRCRPGYAWGADWDWDDTKKEDEDIKKEDKESH
ncbi:hypothetical protein CLV51_1011517 [Chitinophaga niastensis]|uniref:Uncharacterized protein n=1 Tax=Chitinophaga niastensis TaxID=536980 RepID=A0A2P8HVB4_CHINA|nr:hypothetical protein [Chitinophaga niastensis]PSL50173.1 hypothetical protein CLV51_1011517 [Chitinophaga niastensis]